MYNYNYSLAGYIASTGQRPLKILHYDFVVVVCSMHVTIADQCDI